MVDKANTPDEIIDRVDENDTIIGQVTKGQANSDPSFIHREIGVLLYDDNQRILCQQRSGKKIRNPLLWMTSCAGHVPSGMSPIEAAHMELKEELGIDTKIILIKKYFTRDSAESVWRYSYLGHYNGNDFTIDPNEVEQARWLQKPDAEKIIKDGGVFVGNSLERMKQFWNGEFDEIIAKNNL